MLPAANYKLLVVGRVFWLMLSFPHTEYSTDAVRLATGPSWSTAQTLYDSPLHQADPLHISCTTRHWSKLIYCTDAVRLATGPSWSTAQSLYDSPLHQADPLHRRCTTRHWTKLIYCTDAVRLATGPSWSTTQTLYDSPLDQIDPLHRRCTTRHWTKLIHCTDAVRLATAPSWSTAPFRALPLAVRQSNLEQFIRSVKSNCILASSLEIYLSETLPLAFLGGLKLPAYMTYNKSTCNSVTQFHVCPTTEVLELPRILACWASLFFSSKSVDLGISRSVIKLNLYSY
jgi:hypothetical protein